MSAAQFAPGGAQMDIVGNTVTARFGDTLAQEARAFAVQRAQAAWPPEAIPAAIALITGTRIENAAQLSNPAVATPILAILRRDLRRERTKSRTRHAGYSFSRHLALFRMLKHVEAACGAGGRKKERAGNLPAPE
jgi:hypothetical protein